MISPFADNVMMCAFILLMATIMMAGSDNGRGRGGAV
jgi:hypothetical protein